MCRKSVEDKTIEINAQLDRDRIKICPQKFSLSFPYFREKKNKIKGKHNWVKNATTGEKGGGGILVEWKTSWFDEEKRVPV